LADACGVVDTVGDATSESTPVIRYRDDCNREA